MNQKIWRVLSQILFHRIDLIDLIKPFFENLNNESINAEKYVPLLKSFSKSQLKTLYQNEIITEEKYISLISDDNEEMGKYLFSKKFHYIDYCIQLEEIISGDKIKELQEFIQEKNITEFYMSIVKPFMEVEKMKIPVIQYCIMKNSIECFKYILVNGYSDPNETMKETFIEEFYDPTTYENQKFIKYKWDCMATAIFYGNKEIIKILEDKGFEKGNHIAHIEAAILSYRNYIAEEILNDINENKILSINLFNTAILTSAKNNNIIGTEFLIRKRANINTHNEKNNSNIMMRHLFILH